jgi:hypothetical protein
MTRLPRRLVAVACLLAAAWPAGPRRAAAQGQPPPFGQGTHAFRRILHDLKKEPLRDAGALRDDPTHTLLIVLGDTDVLAQVPDGLEAYLSRGGAALVATDRWWQWHPTRGGEVEVFGDKVTNLDASMVYRDIPDCPYIKGFPQKDSPLFRTFGIKSLLPGLHRVATNRPSYLRHTALPGEMQYMARFVKGCDYGNPRLRGRGEQFFAAGGPVGEGRLLVLADHSVFINDMMLEPDTDNIAFTYNCIDWLSEGGEERNRVLFLEEGEVRSFFDIPLKEEEPRLPPLDALVPLLDEKIHELEIKDAFNKLVQDMVPYRSLLAGLALALTALLAANGLYLLARSRHRIDLGAPLLDTMLRRPAAARTLMEQRYRALLYRGNLWEPARAVVRQAFEAVGWPGLNPRSSGTPPAPQVQASGGWWRRRRLERLVRRLWQMAYGEKPVPVSARDFTRLATDLDEVQAALAAGALRLDFPPDPAATPPRPAPVRPRSNEGNG